MTKYNPVLIILATLAVYRLAQLLAYDDGPLQCFAKARRFVGRMAAAEQRRRQGRYGWRQSLAELFNCPYCLGVWFAFPFAVIIPGNVVLLWLAISGGQAYLEARSNHREE